jgi:hypothetical protein
MSTLAQSVCQCVLAALFCMACTATAPVDQHGCDICTTSVRVTGAVRDSAGQPARGVVLVATAFRDSCAGREEPAVGFIPSRPETDSLGRYRFLLRSLLSPHPACVAVWGYSRLDTTLIADTVRAASVALFRADYPGDEPRDSVAVGLVLRHR